MTTVRVVQVPIGDGDSVWVLRTELGVPVGERMVSVIPTAGDAVVVPLPVKEYEMKINAERDAIRWNVYLAWAKGRKKKGRG